MNKFSKIEKKVNTIEKVDYLYDGYLKVKSKNGWEYVVENDCSVAMVHLIDLNEILIRKEIVPPFQERHAGQEFFLTTISGTMKEGESPIQTITRELVEEAGIQLNTNYTGYESWGEFFWCKGNTSKCHIFYMPLRVNDFRKVNASGDGSDFEKNSKTVRVDLKYLDALKPSDLLTAYCLEKMKSLI